MRLLSVQCVSETKEKCPASSLTVANKNRILTVVEKSERCEPGHKANRNSGESSVVCRHAKRCEWLAHVYYQIK